jgi:hypothetical protein
MRGRLVVQIYIEIQGELAGKIVARSRDEASRRSAHRLRGVRRARRRPQTKFLVPGEDC